MASETRNVREERDAIEMGEESDASDAVDAIETGETSDAIDVGDVRAATEAPIQVQRELSRIRSTSPPS